MNTNKFIEEMAELERRHIISRQHLYSSYIKDNRRFANGDTISCNGTVIVVGCVKYMRPHVIGNNNPTPKVVYFGKELTKKMVPRKDGAFGRIRESDDIELIRSKS